MASIEVLNGTAAGTRLELADELYIGRASPELPLHDCFLPIDEVDTSREHARIRRNGRTYVIEDLHSTNGTVVGSKQIMPGIPCALQDGTPIRIATTRLVFHGDANTGARHGTARSAPDAWDPNMTLVLDARQIQQALRDGEGSGDHEQTAARLKAITRVSIALGGVRNMDELTAGMLQYLFEIFPPARRAFVMLSSRDNGDLYPVAEQQRDGTVVRGSDIPISRSIVGLVLDERKAFMSVDAGRDSRINLNASVRDLGIRSVICAPLLADDEVLGLIQVETRESGGQFSGEDLEILTGICAQMGIVVRNLQLYGEIDSLFESFIRASVQTIESRDPVTAGHSFRVADYTERLARAVNRADGHGMKKIQFSDEHLREIRFAALLHDFGKISVREEILTKEKKLHGHRLTLLEQRFRYARACLEAQAYRDLLDAQEHRLMDQESLRRERLRVEKALEEEVERLMEFYKIICSANEPTVMNTSPSNRLREIAEYRFLDGDGRDHPLLEPVEHDDLQLSRGSLTPRERTEIEGHVSNTFRFLSAIPWTGNLSALADIAHGHHEKLDGSGYPRGLRGDQIPIQTRMLTIADIFDALNSGDRPYKEAIPVERSLDILDRESRSGRIDRSLFRIFLESRVYEQDTAQDGFDRV